MNFFQKIVGKALKPIVVGMGKRRLADHQGIHEVKELLHDVEIRRDPQGVPYIYAKNEYDLFFAQGYVHAQDRFWQMEVNRRLSQGRLCEVFGEGALHTDRISRTLGFHRLAKHDLEIMDAKMRKKMLPYVRGVNAWLENHADKLPIEFKLAGYKPEPWKETDILSISRMMGLRLSIGWVHELAALKMVDALGEKAEELLRIRYPEGNPTTLPNGIEVGDLMPDPMLDALSGPFHQPANGSNAWAISGHRTDTGKPYLCSDPHLPMLMPSVWYQIYLEGGDYRCQGVSIPGIPLIMIGHNNKIAWGITLSFTDIADTYIEEFNPENPLQYKFQDNWKTVRVEEEAIQIKGKAEPHIEKVTYTDHGVVISSIFDTGAHKLTLCSSALEPSRLVEGWYSLDKAQNWKEFSTALGYIDAPGLNIVYADVDGNIGHYVTGRSPIRKKGNGSFPSPGWTGEYDWEGYIPHDQMPHTLNPKRGHIISCNHKMVPDDYPWSLGDAWMNGYRAQRLEELLSDQDRKYQMSDFPAWHMDFQSIPGKQFAAMYRTIKHPDPKVQAAIQRLVSWDGQLTANSIAGTLYLVTKQQMTHVLVAAQVGQEVRDKAVGGGLDPVVFAHSEYQGHDIGLVMDLLHKPDSEWLRNAGGKDAVLKKSMELAVEWLSKNMGNSMDKWQWGKLHTVTFPHPMAVKKPLDYIFNVGPFPIGGDTDTVCQTAFKPYKPYDAEQACPSYRHIVDMSNFANSQWVLPPGQSGQIGSKHYDDQVQHWLNGKYYPMMWDREQVEAGTKTVLHLKGKKGA